MTSDIQTISHVTKLRKQVDVWKRSEQKIAFVPTMGALHDGHLSLIKHAQNIADKVIVSIFVNPTQFSVGEDLSVYPRPLKDDKIKLISLNVNVLYTPEVKEVYPKGFATSIHVDTISSSLCGASRPTHFDGVALIVTKLLLQALPDFALFGEKDFQQLMVIKRLVTDLDIPVTIESVPIFRESDGLAMSSRNIYLDPQQRLIAPDLYQILQAARKQLTDEIPVRTVLKKSQQALQSKGFKVDYFELRSSDHLEPVSTIDSHTPARLFAAVYLGKTRLIDNIDINLS